MLARISLAELSQHWIFHISQLFFMSPYQQHRSVRMVFLMILIGKHLMCGYIIHPNWVVLVGSERVCATCVPHIWSHGLLVFPSWIPPCVGSCACPTLKRARHECERERESESTAVSSAPVFCHMGNRIRSCSCCPLLPLQLITAQSARAHQSSESTCY